VITTKALNKEFKMIDDRELIEKMISVDEEATKYFNMIYKHVDRLLDIVIPKIENKEIIPVVFYAHSKNIGNGVMFFLFPKISFNNKSTKYIEHYIYNISKKIIYDYSSRSNHLNYKWIVMDICNELSGENNLYVGSIDSLLGFIKGYHPYIYNIIDDNTITINLP